jgi:hypothetical protein
MTFFKIPYLSRLLEIKELQLRLEKQKIRKLNQILCTLVTLVKKRKI